MVEDILSDYYKAYGLQSFSLRYFNAAGAAPDGEIGKRHDPETHLIPFILQVASGCRTSIAVFGRDYQTLDGTCIRDYIHVNDLAAAHKSALHHLVDHGVCHACNLGTGQGYSLQQVIDAVKFVTSCSIKIEDRSRRDGDPVSLIADSSQAHEKLVWTPKLSDLYTIIDYAWQWEKKLSREA